jgi:PRC-barrel domain
MRNDVPHSGVSELCYLQASKVTSPGGTLAELDLLNADGESLGSIEGVVIEAAARRVRYYDVQSSGWLRRHRFLVPADQLAQLDVERKAVRLRTDVNAEEIHGIDPATIREFSDDDLLAILFRSRAA